MCKRFALLLAVVAFAFVGCFEADEEFTLNADGSGKVAFTRVLRLGVDPTGGAAGGDPEELLKTFVTELLRGWKGVEAWKDVSFAIQNDGRGRVSGTAYFPDIRAFGTGEEIFALNAATVAREGDRSWRIVLGQPEREAQGQAAAGAKPAPAAALSEEELDKAVRNQRAQFQGQKPMMEMILGNLKIERRFRVPGKIAHVRALAKVGDDQARFSVDGAKLLQAIEQAVQDDQFMRASVSAAPQGAAGGMPPGMEARLFGDPGPAAIEVSGEIKDLFDYASEVKGAKSTEATLQALGLVGDVVPVAVRTDGTPAFAAPAAGAAPAAAGHPAGSAEQPGAGPSVDAGDVRVSASAALAGSAGLAGGRSYSNPIEVEMTFSGGAAASAFRFGRVSLSSAVDDAGRPLERIEDLRSGALIDREGKDSFSDKPLQPPDGFRTTLRFFRPDGAAVRMVRLTGTVAVTIPKKVVVDGIGALLASSSKIVLENPALVPLGVVTLSRASGRVTVNVNGNKSVIEALAVNLRDASGNRIPAAGASTSSVNDRMTSEWEFAPGGDLAQVALEVLVPQQTAVVPFDLREIQLAVPAGVQQPQGGGRDLPATAAAAALVSASFEFGPTTNCCNYLYAKGDSGASFQIALPDPPPEVPMEGRVEVLEGKLYRNVVAVRPRDSVPIDLYVPTLLRVNGKEVKGFERPDLTEDYRLAGGP